MFRRFWRILPGRMVRITIAAGDHADLQNMKKGG
jgi:hypothetical protein